MAYAGVTNRPVTALRSIGFVGIDFAKDDLLPTATPLPVEKKSYH